jgi:ketosteroid isomerase-like protein
MSPIEIVTAWLAAINRHDVTALASLMTPDHVFIDSLGNRVSGAASMEQGWRGYFAMCPGYWIRADHVLAAGNTVLAAGEAGGTINSQPWRTPAAFRSVIRDERVAEWQVFADNKPVYEILAQR